jgi:glucosamine-6-phosphate deaminase
MRAPFTSTSLPNRSTQDYLTIPAAELGLGQPVQVRVAGDQMAVAEDLARVILDEVRRGESTRRGATLILPVGPVDHYPILARLLNEQKISCRNSVFILMDEYLDDDDQWIPEMHALSFRGFVQRKLYDLLDPNLAPPPEHRVVPDPRRPLAIQQLIDARGGVDACFGGLGITGHLAFNEPPEPGEQWTNEQFAALPTRVLSLSRETRTINSVTVGGEINLIPRRAITVGMKEILASKRLRFYCNRSWQSAVVRRALHGPFTSACPASFLRTHPDASLTIADYVAAPPDIRLR